MASTKVNSDDHARGRHPVTWFNELLFPTFTLGVQWHLEVEALSLSAYSKNGAQSNVFV